MKFSIVVLSALISTACASKSYKPEAYVQPKTDRQIRVSVIDFKNKSATTHNLSGKCRGYWFYDNADLGDAFHELTIDELSHYPKLTVLERNTIQKIRENETNLNTSDNKTTFTAAEYTIAGTVDSFEYCSGNSGLAVASQISQSLFGVSGSQETASVSVTLRLIRVKTGEVIGSAKGLGKQTRSSASFDGLSKNVSVDSALFQQSSLGDAIREAIHNGTSSLIQNAKI